MKKYEIKKQKPLKLFEKGNPFNQPAKRINIVSLKLVRDSSILYKQRRITSPEDAYKLLKDFLVDSDRERFFVVCLDTKNQPTAMNFVFGNKQVFNKLKGLNLTETLKQKGLGKTLW